MKDHYEEVPNDLEDGGKKRVECSWTTPKANIKTYRSKLDAEDVATQRIGRPGPDEFAKHFYTVKSGRRTAMKSQ